MNKIEDERLKFYLRNVRLIREWADLGSEVCDVVHRFLCSLSEDIEALAGELDGEVVPFIELDGNWPKLFLQRPAWNEVESGSMIAGIGIEWTRKVELVTELPYIGVWIDKDHAKHDEMRQLVSAKLDSLPSGHGFKKGRGGYWPAFEYCGPDGEFWDDLEPYRQKLVGEIRRTWGLFAPVIDEALVNS